METTILRIILVVGYVCFGSGVFYLLEKSASKESAAGIAKQYNNTLETLVKHCTTNESDIGRLYEEFLLFFPIKTPTSWDFLDSLALTIQTVTTIGKILWIL